MLSRSTIAVVVIALLGVAALLLTSRRDRGAAPPAEAGYLVTDLPVEAITRVTLERAGQPRMVFVREGTGWMQVEPLSHPMDAFSMRQFGALAAQLQVASVLDPGRVDAAALGLQPPQAVLTCEWPDGSVTLSFGRRAVAGRSYVRVTGDPAVYVVAGELPQRAVEIDPKEWRDRTLFHDVSVDADEVVIQDADRRTVLRRDRKQWMLQEPVVTRLDAQAGDDFFSALGRARSGGFILDRPDDPSKFGLDAPSGSVRVVTGDTVQALVVGGRMGVGSEDRFGMVEGRPVVVRLPAAVIAALFRPAEDLIDPTGTGVPAADVKSIVIRRPDGELTLQRDLDRWNTPDGTAVGPQVVGSFLSRLTEERAMGVEIAPYPAEHEVAQVTLYGFGGRPLDTVRVVRFPDSGQWAMENGDGVLRLFPAEAQLPLAPADFGLTP